jgi:glycerophosphoryl diester phosphodiesterase
LTTGVLVAERVSRRFALGALGLGAAAGVGGTFGVRAIADRSANAPPPPGTVEGWKATRGDFYLIAHRGSGDVYPEHSMEAYEAAVAWGAQCMEISVVMTADGVLICQHDLRYDRTTTITGKAANIPSTVLRSARLSAPWLGPAWATEPLPRLALLEEVLRVFGGRVVLALEAKDEAAHAPMIALVERLGLRDSVIIKLPLDSANFAVAKQAGYPLFAYFGSAVEVSADAIREAAAKLDPTHDYLIMPIPGDADYEALVRQAVATKIPVWLFPLHRRRQLDQCRRLGVAGAICSSFGYLSKSNHFAIDDTWSSGAVAPGEMWKTPGAADYAPKWEGNELVLDLQEDQHFITMGQFGPLENAAARYRITVEACWRTLPSNPLENISLVFGHENDAYYEHRQGNGDGYHAILRADGRMQLFTHTDGAADGDQVGPTRQTEIQAGQWIGLQVDVTPTSISWSRTDVPDVEVNASDTRYRGGYFHLGRSSTDGVLAFRGLKIR